jgi:predicted ATPase
MTLWPLGVVDRAGSIIEEAVYQAFKTRHMPTIAYGRAHGAIFAMICRDRPRAAPHVQALLDLAREHEIPLWMANGTFMEGWLQLSDVSYEVARSHMETGMSLMRLQQQGIYMPLLMAVLAETEAEAGRPDAALEIVDTQLAAAEQTGQRWYLSELYRSRGELLLKRRRCDEAAAESAFARAIDLAQTQSAKLFELQATVSLGRLWLGQGKRAHARELVAPICARFDAGLDCDALSKARALMRDLAAS